MDETMQITQFSSALVKTGDDQSIDLTLTVTDGTKENTWDVLLPCTADQQLSGDSVASALRQLADYVENRSRS